ncbi:MAG: hypothetical protein Q7J31_02890 [Syntrophales bacterium]|nr:hypothetical protein [Syntrophales bacterium]
MYFPVAGDFRYVINAATCDIGDARGDVIMVVVDHMGGAQLQGEFYPQGIFIDAYDLVCADDASRHERCQADHSHTEDCIPGILGDFSYIKDLTPLPIVLIKFIVQ